VQRKKPNLRDMAARQLLPGGRGTREGKSARLLQEQGKGRNRGTNKRVE
jgi:hypothetical protein